MGDKGGKKDKAKNKQQHDLKQKAEAKRTQEKSPRKSS
jgi:hypothetical protein